MNQENVLVGKILPHPVPLPLGEGELSADGWLRRWSKSVHDPNASEKAEGDFP